MVVLKNEIIETININSIGYEKHIINQLEENGYVLFEGSLEEKELVELSVKFGNIFMHNHANSLGVTHISNISKNVDSSSDNLTGFSNDKQDLHTDRSSELEPPNILFLYCKQASYIGGESWIADGKKIFTDLSENHPETLRLLIESGNIVFGGSNELRTGAVFLKNYEGNFSIKYRDDELGYFPYYMYPHISILRQTFQKYLLSLSLKSNQGLIIKNDRVLHGRNFFQGERSMLRVLIHSKSTSILGSKITKGFLEKV